MDAFDEYEFENPDDDDQYDNPEDDNILESGFADIERTSKADECGGLPIIMSGNLADLNKDINLLTQDPLERFKRLVGAISHSIDEDGLYQIGVDDRNKMCLVASNLENVKYLNPTAYILGFLSTNGGGSSINDKIIKRIFNFLDRLRDDSVKQPDVIRYARFWIGLQTNVA